VFWRIAPAELTGDRPSHPGAASFREAMSQKGWWLGTNVEILWRSAEGNHQRAEAILDELVRLAVDVIIVTGNDLTKAAKVRTRTIPIIVLISHRPVEEGLVASLTRPGGNVTGMVLDAANLNAKRLALLKEAAPPMARVAYLQDGNISPMTGGLTPQTRGAAASLGITLLPYSVDTHPDLESAIVDAVRKEATGVLVDTSLAAPAKDQPAFHALAERYRLPMMHAYRNATLSGGLMYYGADTGPVYRRAAEYVDRLLRGAKAAEMPMEQSSTYELIVNLKAAKTIGLTLPAAFIAQANQLIQ
jgi:putative ABC transport system substrate-binding protein